MNTGRHYIFSTKSSADFANHQISSMLGLPKRPVCLDTSCQDDSGCMTETWCVPIQTDLGWLVPVPEGDSAFVSVEIVENPSMVPIGGFPFLPGVS
jgi:hypothetical protein